jgi:hypothetical protein
MKKIIFLVSIAFFFVACEPSEIVDVKGKIRLINASSNVGDINMFVDYEKVYATNVQYLNYSLFREYIATKHTLQIKDAVGNLLIDTSITVEDKKAYTVFVYDSLANLKIKFVTETFLAPQGSACKLRFLNLSKDDEFVDVYKTGDSSIQFLNFANGQHSEYLEFQSGFTEFDVSNSTNGNARYHYFGYALKPGYYYTMFLKGTKNSLGKDSLGIFTIENNTNY